MCTVVVSLQPAAPVPLLLLGVRDEFTGRPWQPPARHWAATEWAPLIGGLDEQAGGTWQGAKDQFGGDPLAQDMMWALVAYRKFTVDDLLPYRTAREPPSQKQAMDRRKIMRKARSPKNRPLLLADLERRYRESPVF